MHPFRSRRAAALLLALTLAIPAVAAAASTDVPTLAFRDANETFPNTPAGHTSTITCLGLCFRQLTSPEGTCDGSGTETLDHAVAAPFSATNFRRGSASSCGGTRVNLPVAIGAGQALWFDAKFSPTHSGTFHDTLTIGGFNFFLSGASGTPTPCVPNATTFCADGNRFAVTAKWKTPDGHTGDGQAVPLTADTGYFWFFSSSNVEVVAKVLDGCAVNHKFWVFAGGLTNVQVDLTVHDTQTGATKTYRNPQGAAYQPLQDTGAFGSCPGSPSVAQTAGTPTGTELALNHGRFHVRTEWRTAAGQTGVGQAVQLTDETGYFWFFSAENVEMVVKALDGCGVNQGFWTFAGGLTNVEVQMTVEDTATGYTKTYHSSQGAPFQPIQDTGAFYCSTAGLPPDPGAAGKSTLAGVDSDHDGVRDDLQRYIVLSYGSSRPTVDALMKTAKIVQGAILDSGSPTAAVDHATDLARAMECLHARRPADAAQVAEELVAQALDTEQRGLAYLAFNDRLGGAAFPLNPPAQWAASCDALDAAGLRVLGLAAPHAAAVSCNQASKATLVFGNGVNNTCAEAQMSTVALAASVEPLLSADERSTVGFATACNPTQGIPGDLWRALKQSFQSRFSAFYRVLAGLDVAPDFFRQAATNKAQEITEQAAVDDPTLAAHVALYKNLIFEGQKIVLTAHSQGNFYANLAYDSLTPDEQASFGIVSVANPDDRVADGSAWTTFTNDFWMNLARLVTGALPGNAGFHADLLRDWSSHQFINSYLATGSINSRIAQQVHDELEALPSPPNQAGNGIITITLTWDHETDVDLHVFEPGGSHVFYADRQGDSGFLDFDNTTGFGPEHYYVACSTLQPGTYRVGVNYFAGDVFPETAHIQIVAGLVARSIPPISLPQPFGTGGNDSPIPVADIIVSGSADTGYSFQVVPLI